MVVKEEVYAVLTTPGIPRYVPLFLLLACVDNILDARDRDRRLRYIRRQDTFTRPWGQTSKDS